LSLYNFSIWSLPYLLSKGATMQELVEFGKITRKMLVAGFDDVPRDFSREERVAAAEVRIQKPMPGSRAVSVLAPAGDADRCKLLIPMVSPMGASSNSLFALLTELNQIRSMGWAV